MPYQLPNGIGAALGDSLVLAKPLALSGDVWFVSSATGNNANNGRDEAKPLATIGQAYTNAAANDIIVLLSGHAETLTGALNLAKAGLVIVGTGLSGGLPTVKLTMNAAAASMLTPSAVGVQLRNIWFRPNLQANFSPRIAVGAAGFRMIGCYAECDQYDSGSVLNLNAGADSARIVNSTFISTATVTAPESAIKTAAALADLELNGVTIDAGTLGFSNIYAMDATNAAVTRLRGESITLSRGADVALHASTTGFFNAQSVNGSSRINW